MKDYRYGWIVFAVLFVLVAFELATPLRANADSKKQVEVTPVQNLKYYGVFPHGVSGFETSDAKCFVNNPPGYDYRSGTAISCFKK